MLIGVSTVAAIVLMSTTINILNPTVPWQVIALVAVFGGMVFPMVDLAVAHANDCAAPDDFVKVASEACC